MELQPQLYLQREFEGRWQVRPAVLVTAEQEEHDGATQSSGTNSASVITHQLSVKPMVSIPGPMGGLMQVRRIMCSV